MSVFLPPDKLADIQQLVLFLLQTQSVTVHQVLSFLGKANLCVNGHSQWWRLCNVIQSDMLTVYHTLTHLFSPVHFFFSALHQLEQLSNLQQNLVCLQFPLPDVVIAIEAKPTHWAFIFRDLVCNYGLVDPGLVNVQGLYFHAGALGHRPDAV